MIQCNQLLNNTILALSPDALKVFLFVVSEIDSDLLLLKPKWEDQGVFIDHTQDGLKSFSTVAVEELANSGLVTASHSNECVCFFSVTQEVIHAAIESGKYIAFDFIP